MISHLMIIAVGFRLTGALLGIAAIAALVDFADTALMMHRLPPDTSTALDVGTYGLVGLLHNGARGVSKAMYAFLTGPGLWFIAFLAFLALLILVVAIVLYFTGRGVGHHAAWARFMAILISIGLAATSCAIALLIRRELVPFALAPIALSLYALWVLIWRFA
jgi:hypothetical protein